jgi:hypothetical protein
MLSSLKGVCPSLLRLSHQLQAVAQYSVQIVVPALGDSISDGKGVLPMSARQLGLQTIRVY